jgi:hypothetical protein
MEKADYVVSEIIKAMYKNEINPGFGRYREDGTSLYNDDETLRVIQKKLEAMGCSVSIGGMGAGYNRVGSDRRGFHVDSSYIEISAQNNDLRDHLISQRYGGLMGIAKDAFDGISTLIDIGKGVLDSTNSILGRIGTMFNADDKINTSTPPQLSVRSTPCKSCR